MKKQLLTSLAVLILGSSVAFASPQESRYQQDLRGNVERSGGYGYTDNGYHERAEQIRRARLRRMEELRRHRRYEQRFHDEDRWDRR